MAEATIPLPTLHLKVKVPPAYGLRMWLFCRLMWLAGKVGPHEVEVETSVPD